ncbi:MAG: phospho-N-acetylmuramoyl-pentapeptide-transferase [Defluviitoga tunisiensis]|jgi:phospho-N-acetylmuramoyl-pentapeptide-transferase|uniref:Phospho-N-acetylmuramoyl-pentapeptide-transferase n=1 Tax=Defluviitoga tunisiensis TaxID=1006576 RepID=A0A0C7P012_DEFTU|nr:phospho-N-acetylmuramoyl-pentapeptide-transferase [Defluviitoga tunisiensis]MDD3600813.1 phospho-N-acetylmuramoyl-pentapeptide-transferase [Defluviitoga tunisiensis]MDY0379412.1 phospho-N-acetylmuramoyl-pentapeptide-transferase [Defluviitoga tunisiensis]CEP77354.1 Phospho-N-acetylmuramoyl-pentapeptide-transferase [Defluviitoga tunisiensis]HHV00973.1 phospho-N-acetylmuramoyl-pentapeptide-transferase [Defluviitoga tunisiensis]HOB55360.1 phospho-N-acetylmuramoyl-pentapeptide-transferase [Deflu
MNYTLFLLSVCAFGLLIFLYPIYINWLKKKQFGQYIRPEGPDLHNYKQGTPTMGGLLFVIAMFLLLLVTFFLTNDFLFLLMAISIILFGLVGFIDDYSSIKKKNATGLNVIQKLGLQLLFSAFIVILIYKFNYHTHLKIPFSRNIIDLKYFYPVWGVLYLTGMTNATNLTDGLDGLAGGIYIISAFFTAIVAGLNFESTSILILPVIAYLFFNIKPAKIFMGDTGSLALGGLLGCLALYSSIELFTLFTCFIFILEMFSVIIQVGSFKLRKKRVFLMAPIHHHFELKKWSEERVVMIFWLVNFLVGFIALGGLL